MDFFVPSFFSFHVGSDHQESSCVDHLFKQGHLEQVAPDYIPMAFNLLHPGGRYTQPALTFCQESVNIRLFEAYVHRSYFTIRALESSTRFFSMLFHNSPLSSQVLALTGLGRRVHAITSEYSLGPEFTSLIMSHFAGWLSPHSQTPDGNEVGS